MQFTKIILNTYLENLWKKERCEERKSENEVFVLDFSDSMQGFFFFLLFLDSFSSQKKTWLGQKIGTKNLKWSALYKIHMFSVLFFRKIFGQQIFLWRFHEIFFYRFCCQNFQWLSRHHYTHRKQQYGCGERSELHCASHSYSQQKYTLGLPKRKMFINICYSIYTVK